MLTTVKCPACTKRSDFSRFSCCFTSREERNATGQVIYCTQCGTKLAVITARDGHILQGDKLCATDITPTPSRNPLLGPHNGSARIRR